MLPRAVHVNPQAVLDLSERIQEKLRTHHIDGMVASADVVFEDKTTIEFGGWAEFESFRWTTSKETKEIRLQWRFLLAVQGYELPQQHALTVKLSSESRPLEVLQAMLSKHPADGDEEIKFAPTICRVDFISHSIGQELISVVEEWNKALPRPDVRTSIVSKLDDHSDKIAAFIDHSTPALFAIAGLVYLSSMYSASESNAELTVGVAVCLMRWLMVTGIAVFVGSKISHVLVSTHTNPSKSTDVTACSR